MQKGDETKERITDVSLDLFHKRGYKNTSINDILGSSGVKKGAFYFHYQSKDKLIVEVLNKALLQYEERIESRETPLGAVDQIVSMIQKIADYHLTDGTSKGCIFGNTALEIGHDGSEVSQFVERVFKRWETRFENLLNQAVSDGELQLKEPAKVFSQMILALIEGGLVLSKISGHAEAFKNSTDFIMSLIEDRKIP
ncbi:MAG: TetR/AcrR family transcriptional regulator [Proteobacteria bacterium]|nr:TetR/AcrR family transcriptional regulator [Pseudomonadota bacterium]